MQLHNLVMSCHVGLLHGPRQLIEALCRMIKDTIENSHLAPSILCALRYGMAAGLMLPFLLKPGLRKVNWGLSFELGLTLFVAYQCQARELVTESASEGSIMLAVYLLLVPLVELVFGRPFTSKKLASLLVAVGGVALLAAGTSPPFIYPLVPKNAMCAGWGWPGGPPCGMQLPCMPSDICCMSNRIARWWPRIL